MNNQTIVSQILKNAKLNPKKLALTSGVNITKKNMLYEELAKKIIGASQYLIEKNIKQGNKVVISAEQSFSFIIGYFATHLVGAIAVPVDPQLTKSQLNYIIKICKPKIVFLQEKKAINKRSLILPLKNLFNNNKILKKKIKIKKNDIADILFTSGTTGDPKGVILTHQNILESAKNINSFIKNTANDLELIPSPLNHSFGLARLRCNFLAGSSIALAEGFLLPAKIFRQLKETKATGISFVPAGGAILLKFGEKELAKYKDQIKYIEIGSSSMPLEHKKKLMKLLPKTRICMHYGSTEASRSCFMEFHKDNKYLDSVGKITPGLKIKIINKDGNICSNNQIGELLIKGKAVCKRYISSKIPMNAEWYKTGDYGYINNKKYIFLVGRKKEMINIGGKKVSPLEIEKIINILPMIKECACVGIYNKNFISGEIIKAFVVKKKISHHINDYTLISHMRKYLEPFKIPSKIIWLRKLPKTKLGKIKRDFLKNSSIDYL